MEQLIALSTQMIDMRKDISNAQHTADTALSRGESHEALCAERYNNISTRLDGIAVLNTELGKVKIIVYIGVGIWIGLPVIAGFFYGLWQIVKGISHGG